MAPRCRASLLLGSCLVLGSCSMLVPLSGVKRADAAIPLAGIASAPGDFLDYGRFGSVAVYRGRGATRNVVVFLSGQAGFTPEVTQMVQRLAVPGTLVAGVDGGHYLSELEHATEACVSPAADVENLSHYLQSRLGLKGYLEPTLVGHAAGATLAYAALAGSRDGAFEGALSLAFCPDLELVKPLCGEGGLRSKPRRATGGAVTGTVLSPDKDLPGAWVAVNGQLDTVCPVTGVRKFVSAIAQADLMVLPKAGHEFGAGMGWKGASETALARLAATSQRQARSTGLPRPVADLPLIIVPPSVAGSGTWFAVFLSGDGGWEALDKGVSQELAKHDIPVVGWNSLRYFWQRRTAVGAARDLDRVVREYSRRWGRTHVLLLGFSQGADTMPFMFNRLPADTHALVGLTALLGISDNALWEFHLATWFGRPPRGVPTAPELANWSGSPYLCLYGETDPDAACAQLTGHDGTVLKESGGHHMGNAYTKIAGEILSRLPAS